MAGKRTSSQKQLHDEEEEDDHIRNEMRKREADQKIIHDHETEWGQRSGRRGGSGFHLVSQQTAIPHSVRYSRVKCQSGGGTRIRHMISEELSC